MGLHRLMFLCLVLLGQVHCASTGNTPPLYEESIDPDEGQQFAEVVRQFKAIQEQRGSRQRAFHSKVHGCMSGEFTLLPDRNKETKEGLFKKDGRFSVVMRFTNGSGIPKADQKTDVRGLGIKVFGVDGEKLLATDPEASTQDFVLNNRVSNLTDDPREFAQFIQASLNGGLAASWFLATHWSLAGKVIALSRHKVESLSKEQYWSGTAFKLGEKAMKYNVKACDPIASAPVSDDPDYLGHELARSVASEGMCWILGVQIQVDPILTPIEESTKEWTEELSPTLPVARITIPRQDIQDPQVVQACRNLNFTPWHSIEEHRPLGRFNRVRRPAYATAHKLFNGGDMPKDLSSFPVQLIQP